MNRIPSIPIVTLKKIRHRGAVRIGLLFGYDKHLVHLVKTLPQSSYSNSLKCWYLPYNQASMRALNQSGIAYTVDRSKTSLLPGEPEHIIKNSKKVKPRKTTVRKAKSPPMGPISEEWMLRLNKYVVYMEQKQYSASSVTSYQGVMKLFLAWYGPRPVSELNMDVLRTFNHEYFFKHNRSRSYQNVWINAMKLFLDKFTDINIDVHDLERPRKSLTLPNVLSEDEVHRLILSYNNLKHKAMIMTIYACGLRKSELINLKIEDLDGDRKVIRIVNSKGAKDRDIALPDALLTLLRMYFKAYRPKIYLFNGQKSAMYSPTSISKVLSKGLQKCGIKKRITPHDLRHSYATHLVEKNVNLRYIQDALGHRSSKTTEIYTRLSKESIAKMVSPVDFWSDDIMTTFNSEKGVDNKTNKI